MSKIFGLVLSLSILFTGCNILSSEESTNPTQPPDADTAVSELTFVEATAEALDQLPVPELPFPDNADPAECGIPQP